MPGGRSDRSDAREQLVPKGEGEEATSSTSPGHRFPIYELPLPGTLPVSISQDALAPSPAATGAGSTGNGLQDGPTHFVTSDGAPAPASGDSATLSGAQQPGPGNLVGFPRAAGAGAPSGVGRSVLAAMEIQEALLPPQPAAAYEHPIPVGRRRWMVAMFCLVAALLYADQNLLAPNLTAAAEYFGMDERQKDVLLGGALMAAFFAVGAPAALVVGWLTDRGDVNRRTLLFWVVVVGETPCLLTYWVTAYWQFFLLRALTGVAVGGCFPLVFSLLGDLFPPQRRTAVSAVVQIAMGVGLAVGQALSGAIGPATNWRVPFVVVAAPSLAVAVLMLVTTEEPPRGAFEEALRERYAEGLGAYEGAISWSKVAVLLRCPSNVIIIAQGLPGSLPWGMMLTYFNDFLSQQKGFSVQAATLVLLVFGAAGAVGVIGGGAGGQWLYNHKKEYQALLAGGCVIAGIGPLYGLVNADLQRLGLAFTCFLAALSGAVGSVAGPNLRSVMLNVNEPETRGVALALQSMTDDLGKGLGPVLVAGLIHTMGRKGAFNVATAGWIPCGLLLLSLACFMRRDEAAMQARLAKSSEAQAEAAEAAMQARRAADGDVDGVVGGGITVPMAPSPPASGSGSTTAAAAAVVDEWREERRMAMVRLLGQGATDSATADLGTAATSVTAGAGFGEVSGVVPAAASSTPLAGAGAETAAAAAGAKGAGAGHVVQPPRVASSPTVERCTLRAAEEAEKEAGAPHALPVSSSAAIQESPKMGAGSGPGGAGVWRLPRATSSGGGGMGTVTQAQGAQAWPLPQPAPPLLGMAATSLPVSPTSSYPTPGAMAPPPGSTAGYGRGTAATDVGPGLPGLPAPGRGRPGPLSPAPQGGVPGPQPHLRPIGAHDNRLSYDSSWEGEAPAGSGVAPAVLGAGGSGALVARWGLAEAEGRAGSREAASTPASAAATADEQPPRVGVRGPVDGSLPYLPAGGCAGPAASPHRPCQGAVEVRQAAEWLRGPHLEGAASAAALPPPAGSATATAAAGHGGSVWGDAGGRAVDGEGVVRNRLDSQPP